MKQKQKLKIKEKEVITGFCYNYYKALLGKLQTLKDEDRLFEKQSEYYKPDLRKYTVIGSAVVGSFKSQFKTDKIFDLNDDCACKKAIDDLIDLVTEFLAIFEKEPEA